MRKILFFLFLGTIVPLSGFSQSSTGPDEILFGIGATQYLGQLGGSSDIGTHFLKDFNLGAIRYAGYGGYRKQLSYKWALKGVLTVGELYGNDDLSSNLVRYNRNQDFRTIVIEPSVQAEFYFYKHDQPSHRYKIKHAHGFSAKDIDAYVFVGLGGFYFNPQGYYPATGEWYNLRPLSTEGEGLPGGPPEYSQFALCFPAGIGLKYRINTDWSLGLELSDRLWTSTDYMDDTHGAYFSTTEIKQYKGPIAAYFADPSLGLIKGQDAIGEERGDTHYNDTYMFLFINANYRIPQSYGAKRRKMKRRRYGR